MRDQEKFAPSVVQTSTIIARYGGEVLVDVDGPDDIPDERVLRAFGTGLKMPR